MIIASWELTYWYNGIIIILGGAGFCPSTVSHARKEALLKMIFEYDLFFSTGGIC